MNTVQAAGSWSGGKDGCLACYRGIQSGVDVRRLVNFMTMDGGKTCFHGIDSELLELQSVQIGIPLLRVAVGEEAGAYEIAFKQTLSSLKSEGLSSMIFGDIFLVEHYDWIKEKCDDVGVNPIQPLWEGNPRELAREFIGLGFKAIVVRCKADVLGEEFIGRTVDEQFLVDAAKAGCCPCGENGEYHTFVFDGPIFKKPIRILKTEKALRQGFWKHWHLDINEYEAG